MDHQLRGAQDAVRFARKALERFKERRIKSLDLLDAEEARLERVLDEAEKLFTKLKKEKAEKEPGTKTPGLRRPRIPGEIPVPLWHAIRIAGKREEYIAAVENGQMKEWLAAFEKEQEKGKKSEATPKKKET